MVLYDTHVITSADIYRRPSIWPPFYLFPPCTLYTVPVNHDGSINPIDISWVDWSYKSFVTSCIVDSAAIYIMVVKFRNTGTICPPPPQLSLHRRAALSSNSNGTRSVYGRKNQRTVYIVRCTYYMINPNTETMLRNPYLCSCPSNGRSAYDRRREEDHHHHSHVADHGRHFRLFSFTPLSLWKVGTKCVLKYVQYHSLN
jgi:hypothetical protein